jgi:hypothetical protein
MSQGPTGRIAALSLFFVIGNLWGPIGMLPAAAQAPAALSETQDVNAVPGVVVEIVQCKREAGVLSIRLRLRNTNEKSTYVPFGRDYDLFYVTAGNKKYFVLRDSEKAPLATPEHDTTIPQGGSYIWYAKYPAPPDEVKKISYYTSITAPFEDIPVSD